MQLRPAHFCSSRTRSWTRRTWTSSSGGLRGGQSHEAPSEDAVNVSFPATCGDALPTKGLPPPRLGRPSSLPLTVPHNYPGSGSYSPALGLPPVPWNGDKTTVRDVDPGELQRTCALSIPQRQSQPHLPRVTSPHKRDSTPSSIPGRPMPSPASPSNSDLGITGLLL